MRELNEQDQSAVYWIIHKTRLLRCAPPEINKTTDTMNLDELQKVADALRNLKSRGMTKYIDLNRVNKRHIDDIDSDEQEDENSDLEEMAKRRRVGAGISAVNNDNDYEIFEAEEVVEHHLVLPPPAGTPNSVEEPGVVLGSRVSSDPPSNAVLPPAPERSICS